MKPFLRNFPFPESDVLVAEMVQNGWSFLLLPSPFGSAGLSPLSPKPNLQPDSCEGSAEFPGWEENFPKPLPFLTWFSLLRSPTSCTELGGLSHSIHWED